MIVSVLTTLWSCLLGAIATVLGSNPNTSVLLSEESQHTWSYMNRPSVLKRYFTDVTFAPTFMWGH